MSSELPFGWKLRAIGELAENHSARRVPVRKQDRHPGPYPYYGASGVVDYVSEYLFEGLHLLIAEDGENLLSRQLPVAFLADGKFWVNNHAHVLTGKPLIADTRFLSKALESSDISAYVSGSAQPKLNKASLNQIVVATPPYDEQRRIAAVLGALDDKIEHNARIGCKLDDACRTQFETLMSLQPASGWERRPIGDLVKVLGGSTPSTGEARFWNGSVAFATPKDLASLRLPVLLQTERRITEEGLGTIGSGLLPVGTVLLSSRAPIGYLAIAELPLAVNQGFIAMRCDGRISKHFALRWAQKNLETIVGNANGTTFLEISKGNFRPLEVTIPPEGELRRFDEFAEPLHRLMVERLRESARLSAIRDLLLPRLVSGEIRVSNSYDPDDVLGTVAEEAGAAV
jgi:type I restriction enzyme S subunit